MKKANLWLYNYLFVKILSKLVLVCNFYVKVLQLNSYGLFLK